MRIKYDLKDIKFISMFQSVTKSKVKDAIVEDNIVVFIVKEGEIAKAVGKGGSNVKRLEKSLKRKIKIVEFSPNSIKFINNLIYPLKFKDAKENEGIITLRAEDHKTRGLLIGRGGQNLRTTENIVKRFFDIQEIKVV